VGYEWAHTQLLGQGEGLLVVGFSLRAISTNTILMQYLTVRNEL
jgi:hypothetical protein